MTIYIILFSIISYLLGSFSSALWFGKWFHNIDVREHGSKNAGATNTFRVLGPKTAIPVFILDILKSFISVKLICFVPNIIPNSELSYLIMILFGVMAVIGHIFPIFSGFKGGKGVASMLGVILAIHPLAAGISLAVFIIVFICFKIVSIGSMCAAIAFPIIIYIFEKTEIITLSIFSISAAILIIITHKKNIKNLVRGEEKKLSFNKKS